MYVESLLIPRGMVINGLKAGHWNEQPLADIQPTSADEPLPHLVPKPVPKLPLGLSQL